MCVTFLLRGGVVVYRSLGVGCCLGRAMMLLVFFFFHGLQEIMKTQFHCTTIQRNGISVVFFPHPFSK